MPKRKDENETAFDVLQEMIRRDAKRNGIPQEPIPNPEKLSYRVRAGRKGGPKGGQTRAKGLSVKERKEIARKAALTRWAEKKRKQLKS